MASNYPLSILVVDDEPNIRRTLSMSLRDLGAMVDVASSAEEGLKKLRARDYDLILTDYRMAGATGLDLIRRAKEVTPNVTIAVMTAYSSVENAVEVMKEGAFDYLPKPFTATQLRALLDRALELSRLRRENADLKASRTRSDDFAGYTSEAALSLFEMVRRVAPTDGLVLLVGESGTGKSGLAKLIHSMSKRASKPFVTVYCTTLAESMIESELFGHVKGAVGKLELADGGTLFLDEIGDLTANGQAKLLRFLQDRVFERIGGSKEISVDTRIIAATNKDLGEAVASGKFREDLYYRLNMLEIILAPLRHRREDVPVMIERFMKDISAAKGGAQLKLPQLPEPVRQLLLAYEWPGNIRELHNVLERLVMLSEGREIKLADLPESIRKPAERAPIPAAGSGAATPGRLEDMEKEVIARVLAEEKNQERAAERLGITKVTLWRKRKQYGLP